MTKQKMIELADLLKEAEGQLARLTPSKYNDEVTYISCVSMRVEILSSAQSLRIEAAQMGREWHGWAMLPVSASGCPFVNGYNSGGDIKVRVTEIKESK
jgi:hypothetical protein